MPFVKLFAVLALSGAAIAAHAADDGVTPYRPSVSTPAQLPTPGQLEFELGGLGASAGGQRRYSVPVLFKLAFSEQWGVLAGGETYVDAPGDAARRVRGFGDTTLTLKRAFVVDDATAFGLELTSKLPTAKDGIGSGKADYTVNSIFSRDFGKIHMDANLNLTRLGAAEEDSSHNQAGASASFALPLSERWGGTAELSGTRRAGAPSTAQALAALAYSPSKQLTFDVGAAHGLNHASGDWSLFGGVVLPLARLW